MLTRSGFHDLVTLLQRMLKHARRRLRPRTLVVVGGISQVTTQNALRLWFSFVSSACTGCVANYASILRSSRAYARGRRAAARLAALLHGAGATPARGHGLGGAFRVTTAPLAIATALMVAISCAAYGLMKGGVGLGVCSLVSGLSSVLARRVIGERTGDTLGATVAITEVAVCLALLAMWRG